MRYSDRAPHPERRGLARECLDSLLALVEKIDKDIEGVFVRAARQLGRVHVQQLLSVLPLQRCGLAVRLDLGRNELDVSRRAGFVRLGWDTHVREGDVLLSSSLPEGMITQ